MRLRRYYVVEYKGGTLGWHRSVSVPERFRSAFAAWKELKRVMGVSAAKPEGPAGLTYRVRRAGAPR